MSKIEKSDLDMTAVIGLGLVSVILFVVLVIAVQAFFYSYEDAYLYEKVHSRVSPEMRRHRAEQIERISTPRIVNEAEGRVTIPIDRAIELTVRDGLGGGE